MALSFPLAPPIANYWTRFDMRPRGVTGRSESPLTLVEQMQEHEGERWEVSATLRPIMDRTDLGQWMAFFAALRSGSGTFLLSDPRNLALMGIGPAAGEFPTVNGTQARGAKTLVTRGWGASRSGILKRGDMLQLAKNYLTFPKDFDNASWVKDSLGGASAPSVTPNAVDNPDPGTVNDADQIDFASTSAGQQSQISQLVTSGPPVWLNRTFLWDIWLRASASVTIRHGLYRSGEAGSTDTLLNLTTSWQHFLISHLTGAATTGLTAFLYNPENQAAKTVYAWGSSLYSLELDARLHMVLEDVSSDANGEATFAIWPRVRVALPDFSPIIYTNARGTFRLSGGIERLLDRHLTAGLGFSAIEAINL